MKCEPALLSLQRDLGPRMELIKYHSYSSYSTLTAMCRAYILLLLLGNACKHKITEIRIEVLKSVSESLSSANRVHSKYCTSNHRVQVYLDNDKNQIGSLHAVYFP